MSRCRARIDALELDEVDVMSVKARLEQRTGRTIHLVPTPLAFNQTSGLCLSSATEDFIVYNGTVSRTYRDHIIAHELGHLLAGHNGSSGATTEHLFPDLVIDKAHFRVDGYSDPQEIEAEVLASLIQTRSRNRFPANTTMLLGVLETAFGLRRSPRSS
ncbi:ImmA/IrrE family metallo-endopeptidase [Nocardia sp. CDC159]|uniref:ImmA/IrrE family metallo-endopeptidase n=1 Tax=Nocardia pulmonis TaxID=2951408 RepID=A0A9X2EGQ7_9NOCA|nr:MULTISPECIES: ImmA/IrrE family metallo-endopeptidase [Nocardia]MCM6778428.1 ImmA/IrrE family metallo-endopeptidase [Nocardia pulmonis]MCM6791317.1 ImmA/IrrE family metallo-endopeptidase [Nocardia sp. CDC159]